MTSPVNVNSSETSAVSSSQASAGTVDTSMKVSSVNQLPSSIYQTLMQGLALAAVMQAQQFAARMLDLAKQYKET